MSVIRRTLGDPLIHFLAGGALIFAASALLHPGSWKSGDDDRTIIVDRATLLKYMQYQSAAFRPEYFEAQLKAMTPQQRQALVDSYVREESMVREARAMGLDSVDYVIRQRLMQKVLFLIDDTATAANAPTDAELKRYYDTHQSDYRSAPTLTFTHVFIDNEVDHPEGREQAALRLKTRLEAAHARFDDAPAYGDRFPYLQNYVDRGTDFIANQFGKGFARAIAELRPSDHWQGPIQSDYGWHDVLITARSPARVAPLDEVRAQVRDDFLAERTASFRKKAIGDLVGQYQVKVVGIDLGTDGKGAGGS